jgi:hypothetical protein
LRRKCRNTGIPTGDDKLCTLHFADDQVTLAEDEQDVHHMLNKLNKEYNNFEVTINKLKTQYVVVGGSGGNLQLEAGSVKGVMITKNGGSTDKIKNRINDGRRLTKQLNSVL